MDASQEPTHSGSCNFFLRRSASGIRALQHYASSGGHQLSGQSPRPNRPTTTVDCFRGHGVATALAGLWLRRILASESDLHSPDLAPDELDAAAGPQRHPRAVVKSWTLGDWDFSRGICILPRQGSAVL